MNSIRGILDKNDYEIYDDFFNFQVYGYWLDEKLEELYPGNMFKGTVPTPTSKRTVLNDTIILLTNYGLG